VPYKIEKGIPLAGQRNKWISLLKSMDIGDSFLLEPGDNKDSVRQTARNNSMKIVSARENNSVRIWRVK
jgi:hypothetical protein|tara:strand:- start:2834 stop:3040 length:207 start_codon:yes stop_codon:yes gene_type:complete